MSTMYFSQYADVDGIINLIKPKISALITNSPRGITIDIKKALAAGEQIAGASLKTNYNLQIK